MLTFHEVRDNVKKRLADKKANVSPTVTKQLNLLYLYCNLVIRDGRRIATSEGLARAETPDNEGDGKYLARKIRSLFTYYQVWGDLPKDDKGGKRSGCSFLDNEDCAEADVLETWLDHSIKVSHCSPPRNLPSTQCQYGEGNLREKLSELALPFGIFFVKRRRRELMKMDMTGKMF